MYVGRMGILGWMFGDMGIVHRGGLGSMHWGSFGPWYWHLWVYLMGMMTVETGTFSVVEISVMSGVWLILCHIKTIFTGSDMHGSVADISSTGSLISPYGSHCGRPKRLLQFLMNWF